MDGFTIYKSDTLKFKEIKAKMIKKGQYFDSLNIKIKDLGYIKKINNGKNEIIILNFNEKKKDSLQAFLDKKSGKKSKKSEEDEEEDEKSTKGGKKESMKKAAKDAKKK